MTSPANLAAAPQAAQQPAALRVTGLGKRFRRTWALRDCDLVVPAGSVTALVGPNGAGKSTLLQLAACLMRPTTGSVEIFGTPTDAIDAALPRIAFLPQDKAVYRRFTVAETLRFGRELNPGWDDEFAHARVAELGLPLDQRLGRLSGGQRTQVALTVALGKRPDLLLLDEPLADLDPVARVDVAASLMTSVLETGLTVLYSSHLVAELARACDHLVVLNDGRVQLSGDLDEVISQHWRLTGSVDTVDEVAARHEVVSRTSAGRQATLVVRAPRPEIGAGWEAELLGLEDLVIALLRKKTEH
ncbi:ABC transporter ATP-binding protein [Pilimelia columellifera]|uniref:ABC transporter ATP-binding protein n=1 Tax=Pilimelia columellifera subsp. columellifera TaxID=706583 RepID=A0ABN3NKV5_9ACTN